MNVGSTAPKNALYNMLVLVTLGRGERRWSCPPKKVLHLGSVVHNVLNMRHKGWWHAFGSEVAQISTRIRLQQLVPQT